MKNCCASLLKKPASASAATAANRTPVRFTLSPRAPGLGDFVSGETTSRRALAQDSESRLRIQPAGELSSACSLPAEEDFSVWARTQQRLALSGGSVIDGVRPQAL